MTPTDVRSFRQLLDERIEVAERLLKIDRELGELLAYELESNQGPPKNPNVLRRRHTVDG